MDYFTLSNMIKKDVKFTKILGKLSHQPQFILQKMLLESIAENDEVAFDIILEKIKNVNFTNEFGESALAYTAYYANSYMFQTLRSKGAVLGAVPKHSFSCKMDSRNEFFTTTIVGKNMLPTNKVRRVHIFGGTNELMYVATNKVKPSRLEIAQQIIDSKELDINARDKEGYSALMYAVECGDAKMAKLLINNGANINQQDKNGNTPLLIALSKKYSPFILKLLLSHGADPNIQNHFGQSATTLSQQLQHAIKTDALAQATKVNHLHNFQNEEHKRKIVQQTIDAKCPDLPEFDY